MTIRSAQGNTYRLRPDEAAWIRGFGSRSGDALLCLRYALLYARQNPSWFLGACRDDMRYTSQLTDIRHDGIAAVAEVLESRMGHPEWYGDETPSFMELGTMPDGTPCVIFRQRYNSHDRGVGSPRFWTVITADRDGMAAEIYSGTVPTCGSVNLSGLYPGISAAVIRKQQKHTPPQIPLGFPAHFIYVYRDDDPKWKESAGIARGICGYFPMGSFHFRRTDMRTDNPDNAVELFNHEIHGLPHLSIRCFGQRVIGMDGHFTSQELMNGIMEHFQPPGTPSYPKGSATALLHDQEEGMKAAESTEMLVYNDPNLFEEVCEAFIGDDPVASRRAAYVMDRMSHQKKEILEPLVDLLISVGSDDPSVGKLRHVARMLGRTLIRDRDKRIRAERLLLNLAWQKRDIPLQIIALQSLEIFSATNFELREFAGPFVYRLMCSSRNPGVVRQAEKTLNVIEYFEQEVHAVWDRQTANA